MPENGRWDLIRRLKVKEYPQTDGVKDGRVSNFANKNMNKEGSIEAPPPYVNSRQIQPNQNFLAILGARVSGKSIRAQVSKFPLHSFGFRRIDWIYRIPGERGKFEFNPYPTAFPQEERYGSTLLLATREQHDQNCTQSH